LRPKYIFNLTFMPIYAYKCDACGHAKDVLQKMSDPQLSNCPSCGQAAFKKQLTAAGFQLKGTGWYVTDFREGGGKNSALAGDAKSESGDSATAATATNGESKSADASSTAAASASAATVTSPTPAAPKVAPAASPASSV
jgi:putative FmdB family regulatory protein